VIGPIDVKDPSGATVATVTAKASAGLWAWPWAAARVTSAASPSAARLTWSSRPTGPRISKDHRPQCRLPKAAAGTAKKGPAGPLPGVKAALEIAGFDVTFKELDGAGKVVRKRRSRNLRGPLIVNTMAGVSATAKLDAQVFRRGRRRLGALRAYDAKLDNIADAAGTPTPDKASVDVAVDCEQAPRAAPGCASANLGGVSQRRWPGLWP